MFALPSTQCCFSGGWVMGIYLLVLNLAFRLATQHYIRATITIINFYTFSVMNSLDVFFAVFTIRVKKSQETLFKDPSPQYF
jgi:hypothetical protein